MILQQAVRSIRRRTDIQPECALILGSGLGQLADAVQDAVVVPTSEVDGYPASTVEGHRGRLVLGVLERTAVLVVQGRVHLYEGHSAYAAAYPVRLAHALGVRRIIITNAAGGIHDGCRPGTLMLIDDHLNLVGRNPLLRAQESVVRTQEAGSRTADAGILRNEAAVRAGDLEARVRPRNALYDRAWADRAEQEALRLGIRTVRGVYAWTAGPSYETKAEIAGFRRLGADAVGMSTVPEALQAAELDMRVLGISTITNRAAGLSREPLSHQDVLRVGRQAGRDLERLLRALVG